MGEIFKAGLEGIFKGASVVRTCKDALVEKKICKVDLVVISRVVLVVMNYKDDLVVRRRTSKAVLDAISKDDLDEKKIYKDALVVKKLRTIKNRDALVEKKRMTLKKLRKLCKPKRIRRRKNVRRLGV